MPLTKFEIAKKLSSLRFLTDAELETLTEHIPTPTNTENVNMAFGISWVEEVDGQDLEFSCGKTERPNRPPNS